MKAEKGQTASSGKKWAGSHLGSQLGHVGPDVVQQAVALLEERVLRVHEGQHL